MSPEKQALLMVRGTVAGMPDADQKKIKDAKAEIEAALAKFPDGHGQMALALLGAELAAED